MSDNRLFLQEAKTLKISKLDEIRTLKFRIKILDEKIKEIKSKMELQAVKYSNRHKDKGLKENILQINLERLAELENKKNQLQMEIDKILDELSELPETLYKVVYYRSVEGLSWSDTAEKMNYSIVQCWRFYSSARKIINKKKYEKK